MTDHLIVNNTLRRYTELEQSHTFFNYVAELNGMCTSIEYDELEAMIIYLNDMNLSGNKY